MKNDATTFVSHLISIHKDEILKQLQKYIIQNVYFENTDYIDSEITTFVLRKLEFLNEGITYIDNMSAEVIVSIDIDMNADVTSNHDFNVSVDVLLSIEYDLDEESFFELEIKSVNNEKPIELTIDEYN